MKKNRPLIAVAIVIALTMGLVGGVAVASHDYTDVGDSHPFHDDISWLAENDIAGGFPDGTYRPGAAVTRQAMASFMRRLAGADPAVDPVVDAATTQGRTAQQLGTTVRANHAFNQLVLPDNGSNVQVLTLTLGPGTWRVDFMVSFDSEEAFVDVACGPTAYVPYWDSPAFGITLGTGPGAVRSPLMSSTGVMTIASTTSVVFNCYKSGGGAGDTEVQTRRAVATKIDTLVFPSP